MNAVWLRLVYIVEFLVAIPAVYTLWSQVGGQGHLDIMPWHWKLVLGVGASISIVCLTSAVIERERVWTRRSLLWLVCLLLLSGLMGAATFYYHLHEAQDESDSEESTTAALLHPDFAA